MKNRMQNWLQVDRSQEPCPTVGFKQPVSASLLHKSECHLCKNQISFPGTTALPRNTLQIKSEVRPEKAKLCSTKITSEITNFNVKVEMFFFP